MRTQDLSRFPNQSRGIRSDKCLTCSKGLLGFSPPVTVQSHNFGWQVASWVPLSKLVEVVTEIAEGFCIRLGLAAAVASGLAQAASEETNSQMMLLPEHYELMKNGVVVFKLETGENLSLTADQYLILEDGLLLITDELAQASIYSLPVMGSVRAQLLSDLEQVATIDGTVAEATPAQTLSITEGQAPRLSEQVELQSYEVAQTRKLR